MISLKGQFIWSTSEQPYPLEKAADGSQLYCKEVPLGALPNNDFKNVAYNIPGLTVDKIFRLTCEAYNPVTSQFFSIPWATSNLPYVIQFYVHGSNLVLLTGTDLSNCIGSAKIIYKK